MHIETERTLTPGESPVRKWLVVVVVIAIVFGLVAVGRTVSIKEVTAVLRGASVPLLVTTLPLLVANFGFRAARFDALLGAWSHSNRQVRFRDVLGSILLNHAANNVLPLRAGDLVRTRDFVALGYPIVSVALSQLIDKAVEAVTLGIWTLPVLVTALAHRRTAWIAVGLCAVGLPVLVWFVRRARAILEERRLLAGRVGDRLPSRSDLFRALWWSFIADGFEVALIYACAESLGIDIGLKACLTVYGAVNLAIAIPSTPGHLGALEAGASLGLIAVGVDRESALAFALVYRVVQWVPVTAAGAIFWMWRGRRRFTRARSRSARVASSTTREPSSLRPRRPW